MTIESDLEAFRGLALEKQIIIQDSDSDPDILCRGVCGELDPLLDDIVGRSSVLITGSVFPIKKIDGRIGIDPNAKSNYAFGISRGVQVAERSAVYPQDVSSSALVIGYLVSLVDESKPTSYVFAPVEDSNLASPDLELADTVITPENQDEVAEYIDSCLLDEEINFTVLTAIFDSIGENELSVEYYLKYVNFLLNPSDYEFEFTSDCLIQVTENPTYENVMQPNTSFKTTCNPERFMFIPEAGGLCIMFKTLDGSGEFLVPIRTLYSGHFTAKK